MRVKKDEIGDILRGSRSFQKTRAGAAAIEAAVVLPLLLILFVISVDLARAYKIAQLVSDCSRETALFVANPNLSDTTDYDSAFTFASEYLSSLKPAPDIEIDEFQDSNDEWHVEVSVTYPFRCLSFKTSEPLCTISRTSRAKLYPSAVEAKSDE